MAAPKIATANLPKGTSVSKNGVIDPFQKKGPNPAVATNGGISAISKGKCSVCGGTGKC